MTKKEETSKRAKKTNKTAILFVLLAFVGGWAFGSGALNVPSRGGVVSKELPANLDYESVDDLYQVLKENYNGELTEAQLLEGLKDGLAEATGDPYTTYFTAKEAESFENDLNNTFSGIGAELGEDARGNIQVIAPIAGFPAEKAGLKAKDIIATINGKTTVGMSVDDAVQVIRGKAGTEVKLQLIRSGEAVEVTITRQNIQVPSVTYETKADGVGYIRVSTFANDTPQLIAQAANALKDSKSLILDMRNNPGGSVDSAVAVASQWLPEGQLIMQEKQGKKVIQTYSSTGPGVLGSIKTAVLVNPGSASASEIVAAALKDNNKGYLIGEKTYGKGVVQQLINLRDGGQLKVTIAGWFRPNGQDINEKGIKPDQEFKISDQDAEANNDTQLQAAEAYLKR
jgi:carboxyl-terminal processing protease